MVLGEKVYYVELAKEAHEQLHRHAVFNHTINLVCPQTNKIRYGQDINHKIPLTHVVFDEFTEELEVVLGLGCPIIKFNANLCKASKLISGNYEYHLGNCFKLRDDMKSDLKITMKSSHVV